MPILDAVNRTTFQAADTEEWERPSKPFTILASIQGESFYREFDTEEEAERWVRDAKYSEDVRIENVTLTHWVYSTTEIRSVADLKRAAESLGSYFFKPSTMRLFNSRILEGVYRSPLTSLSEGYFITSERFDDSTPRTYRIRRFDITPAKRRSDQRVIEFLDISTISEHDTKAQAVAALKAIHGATK